MGRTSPDIIARFARLPRNPAEVWQGGILRMPTWIERGPDGRPYRPWGALWVSRRSGRLNTMIEPEPGAHGPALLLESLLEFGIKKDLAGCRPGRLEVATEEIASYLRESLAEAGVTVSVAKDLSAVTLALKSFTEFVNQRPLLPDAMRAPGVTLDGMRAFAAAAKAFYSAAPWRYLSDEDLIHVEAPAVDPGFTYLTLLGRAGQTFGVGFYRRPEELEALIAGGGPDALMKGQGHWSVLYGPVMDMPFDDADLWETHGLPVAGDQAYPVVIRMNARGDTARPDATQLRHVEVLLRALAETTEEEIDCGRWTKEVGTPEGPRTVTLSIPALLEPLDGPPQKHPGGIPDRRVMERTFAEIERFTAESNFQNLDKAGAAIQARFVGPMNATPSTATTPLKKAQDLMYKAFEARGRQRIQLARMALEVSPDCADAYVLLAEETSDLEQARALYSQGIAAGERALGPNMLEEEVGNFWGMVRTRPYMRARLGLAQCLDRLGSADEAIGHYRDLLRLNPNDNQGVRYILLPRLLGAGRDVEAGTLLSQYAEDCSAIWQYGWALWMFRQEGDSAAARDRLHEAVKTNRHVPTYLTGKAEMPETLPDSYSFGSVEEAVFCTDELLDVWKDTPGALTWLLDSAPRRKPRASKRHRR